MADDMNKDDRFLESNSKTEEDDSEPVGNPIPPTDVDLDLLRGDRIGDTVYSGKWCIQTVMKLLQSNVVMKPEDTDQTEEGKVEEVVDMEEDLQNEVGVLWDMTSNVEVCQYLQSVGAIESIYHVIANSRCPRATEMCVGMLGNIVTHDELWQCLHTDNTLFAILIPTFSSTDQPVLVELTRFFTTAMSHTDSRHCYTSMYSYGPLVAQELVRILSGSTNCDLLKQTTELTHILMCLDKDDSHFNALFADSDFIVAVLEASKEIGYEQESSSQSCIMEILHCFTTYQAGINAMETCMESVTEAITKYLRSLCHSLNLSSDGDIITIIITLLNHIFCRNLVVRIELMSSSKFLQYILKILVALYRRLGLYDSIADVDSPHYHHHRHQHNHHHHHHHHKHHHHRDEDSDKPNLLASTAWESTAAEDEEVCKSSKEAAPKSWSERAGAGDSTPKHSFATPDPSPKQAQMMKEVDFLSWSERRMASPLVDGGDATDVWKIPLERKARKKKMKAGGDDYDKGEAVNEESSSGSGAETKETEGMDENLPTTAEAEERGLFGNSSDGSHNNGMNDSSQGHGVRREQGVRHESTDSHHSGGFSPSVGKDADESMETEHHDGNTELSSSGRCEEHENGEESADRLNISEGVTARVNATQNQDRKSEVSSQFSSEESTAVEEEKGQVETDADIEKEGTDTWQTQSEAREGKRTRRTSYSTLDKYEKLLRVVREFLSDFFNNMREGLLSEQGKPIVSDVMSFLKMQCGSTSTVRVLVHCVGPSKDISTPVGRLIHLASHLNMTKLHDVLLECTSKSTN